MLELETMKPRSRSRYPGNTGQLAALSTRQNATRNMGAKGNRVRTTGEVQPRERPNLRPMIKQSSPPTNNAAPATSNAGPDAVPLRRRSKTKNPKMMAITANGVRPRNIHSQPTHPSKRPAPIVPASIPSAWLPTAKPMLNPRRRLGKTPAAMAGDTANRQPVPNACSTRNPTTVSRLGEKAMKNMAAR